MQFQTALRSARLAVIEIVEADASNRDRLSNDRSVAFVGGANLRECRTDCRTRCAGRIGDLDDDFVGGMGGVAQRQVDVVIVFVPRSFNDAGHLEDLKLLVERARVWQTRTVLRQIIQGLNRRRLYVLHIDAVRRGVGECLDIPTLYSAGRRRRCRARRGCWRR